MPTTANPSRTPLGHPAFRVLLALYWIALATSTHWPNFQLPYHPPIAGLPLDKWAHLTAFTGLTFLLIASGMAGRSRSTLRQFLVGIAIAFVYAPIDESTQYFVAGRDVELGDLLGNWSGVAIGATIAALLAWAILPSPDDEEIPPESFPDIEGDTVIPVAHQNAAHKGHNFVGAAKVVSALTFVSRLAGLGRDSIQARVLGQEAVADSFAYGFQVPNLFRRLFGEGALTAAFIPVYTDLLARDREQARRFAWSCLTLMTAILVGVTIIGEAILLTLRWGYIASPDADLTVHLTMIMLPYMVLVCLVAMFGTILQVHGRFAPAAAMPVLLNVVMGAAMIWSTWGVGVGDESALARATPWIAWSVLLAGVWQVISQGSLVLRYERPTFDFRGTAPAMKIMLATWVPMLVALSVFQLNTFVDSNIAYFLSPKTGDAKQLHILGMVLDYPIGQGGLAALFRSQLLYQFPLGVFGIAIATAVFPALAEAAAETGPQAKDHFRTIIQHGLRLTFFVGMPASIGLFMVRLPLCRVVFEGHRFTLDDSLLCASIVAAYAPAIWAYSMTHVLTRGFYAVKDSKSPMTVSLYMVVLNFLLNISLVWFLGPAGLALATAICAVIQCVVLARMIGRYVDHPIDRQVWRGWARTLTLSLLVAAALAPILYFFDPAHLSKRQTAIELVAMVALGACVYLAGAWLSKAEELEWLTGKNVRK